MTPAWIVQMQELEVLQAGNIKTVQKVEKVWESKIKYEKIWGGLRKVEKIL